MRIVSGRRARWAFTCVEPFNVWTMTFDGQAVQTSSADLAEGRKDGPLVDLQFEVEAKLAAPPWVQGALQADASSTLKTSIEGDLMGGPRYEQLFPREPARCGLAATEHAFNGSGLRIRRQGVRRLEGFWGHCWQYGAVRQRPGVSATSPNRRAPDGQPTFNEGYLFDGDGDLIPARVVEAPWADDAAAARRRRLRGAGDRRREPSHRGRDSFFYPRHQRSQRDSGRPVGQARELDVPGAAAGGGALSMGR